MTIREDITQGVRDWLKRAAVDDATDLTDAQVIVVDEDAPRPPPPYLTVRVITPGTVVGHDERLHGVSGGVPIREVAGVRRATVSVQGFGAATADWLEEAVIGLQRVSVLAITRAAGISVELLGDTSDLSTLLDSGIEPRFARDFAVLYGVRGGEEALTEMLTAEIAMTFEGEPSDPDPLTTTIVA